MGQPGEYPDLVTDLHQDDRSAGPDLPLADERHDLIIPLRDLIKVFRVKEADTITLDRLTYAVVHPDAFSELIQKPVW